MLSIIKILPIATLILAIILIVMCVIIHVLITKENARWRDYKFSNIIVEAFEMYDKGILSADKDKDIEHIKQEYNEQYQAYNDHKYLKDEFDKLMVKSGLFSFLSLLLSSLCYMISSVL